MLKKLLFLKILGLTCILFIFIHCSENPIVADLGHLTQSIQDTTIFEISSHAYTIAPKLGSTDRLYFGSKNGLKVKFNLFEMPNSNSWKYLLDSSITIDSILFKVYSNDSNIVNNDGNLDLFFSPDSHFDEINSSYNDFNQFSLNSWQSIGGGLMNSITDSLDATNQIEITWNLIVLEDILLDTLDSNLVQTFAMTMESLDTSIKELYSREATSGSKDPKIQIFYRQSIKNSSDSLIIDTLSYAIFAKKDLTVMDNNFPNIDTLESSISLGFGHRMILSIDFSLPKGAHIKHADLILKQGPALVPNNYSFILDPLDQVLDTSGIHFQNDPFISKGYPWTMNGDLEDSLLTIGMKYFLQNVNMENTENFGVKILPANSNNPFQKVTFLFNSNSNKPRLEIVYVVS